MNCPKCSVKADFMFTEYRGCFIKEVYRCPKCKDRIKKRISRIMRYKRK